MTKEEVLLYRCGVCGTDGVKLWRRWGKSLDRQKVLCIDCAEDDQSLQYKFRAKNAGSIGNLVAAVPTDGGTFWSYSSIPQENVLWWDSLPARQNETVGLERFKRL